MIGFRFRGGASAENNLDHGQECLPALGIAIMQHTPLGDIAVVVGHYPDPSKKDSQTGQPIQRNRYRRIGTLMRTDHSDGESRYWLRIHGEALSSGLLMLALRAKGKKGDSEVIANVFPEEKATPQAQPNDPDPPDDGDPVPY